MTTVFIFFNKVVRTDVTYLKLRKFMSVSKYANYTLKKKQQLT